MDYHSFSSFIKFFCSLKASSNIVFFWDFDNEQELIYDINCIWTIAAYFNTIPILIITLNNNLTNWLIRWVKVSPIIKYNFQQHDVSIRKIAIN